MENMSFDYLIEEYMVDCRSRQLREKTLKSYEQTLWLFQRWCAEEMGLFDVDKITEPVIRRYINSITDRDKYTFYSNDLKKSTNYPDRRRDYRQQVSITTINNYLRNLRAFFNWLDADYRLKKNPMKKIHLLKYNRKAKEYISDEDFKKLINNLDKSYYHEHHNFAMIMLMIDSGMRLGECSCLLVNDIDLAGHKVFLRAEITKGRKDRTVFFSPKTENIIRRWLQFKDRYVESDYLFPIMRSGAHIDVSNFETNFKRYIQRVGLKENISPHCLRNNFANEQRTFVPMN